MGKCDEYQYIQNVSIIPQKSETMKMKIHLRINAIAEKRIQRKQKRENIPKM